ncbi:MAG: hypothetical protein RBU23_13005 [Candidatus Auribacterota bacterium]|jgi:hypothetical protein|nr:hypothetical protein [Candidatus Auribacterota bacterium]
MSKVKAKYIDFNTDTLEADGTGKIKVKAISPAMLSDRFKTRAELTGTSVDWSAGVVFWKTLTGATTLTFSNMATGESKALIISGNYALTLPASVKKITGEYDGTVSNLIQLLCVNATSGSEEVWCVISQKAA